MGYGESGVVELAFHDHDLIPTEAFMTADFASPSSSFPLGYSSSDLYGSIKLNEKDSKIDEHLINKVDYPNCSTDVNLSLSKQDKNVKLLRQSSPVKNMSKNSNLAPNSKEQLWWSQCTMPVIVVPIIVAMVSGAFYYMNENTNTLREEHRQDMAEIRKDIKEIYYKLGKTDGNLEIMK